MAGYLHAGETYERPTSRRAFEELGVEQPFAWVGRPIMADDASAKFGGVFCGEITGEQPRIREHDHIVRPRWCHLVEIDIDMSQEP